MKFLLAPDSFKESLSARVAALAMERGLKRAIPDAETVVLPIADGGEGTLDTLVFAAGGQLHWTSVTGPLGTAGSPASWWPSGGAPPTTPGRARSRPSACGSSTRRERSSVPGAAA